MAEGLQDREAEAILLEAGCDGAQGFLIGRPMDEPEITPLLMEHFSLVKPDEAAGGVTDGLPGRATERVSGELAAAADQSHPVDLETA